MATEKAITELTELIESTLGFQDKDLVRRHGWGSITFENAESDLKRTFSILDLLKVLPLEYLTDSAVENIKNRVVEVQSHLQQIDNYNIEQGNPTQVRDNLVAQFHQQSDTFYEIATPWIPFLAYQKGDVAENINALTKSVRDAEGLLSEAKGNIETKAGEIDGIIEKAREASAAAGAAVFTQDFADAASTLEDEAKSWLRATAIFAAGTAAFALLLLFIATPGLEPYEALQKFGTKIIVFVLLFSATFWCGKNYKALRHQATNNRHRSLALQTFQAFSAAASDESTKNSVLLETTRSIFSNTASGFIDSASAGESPSQIVEVIRSASSQGREGNA